MQIHQETPVGLGISANKCFGKNARSLFLSWNALDRKRLRPHQLSNEAKPHVDVLGPCRAKCVSCQRVNPIVVCRALKHFSESEGMLKDNTLQPSLPSYSLAMYSA